jgi:aldehyde:ferredoxin oxidoreductase
MTTALSNITSSKNMTRGAVVSGHSSGYWGPYLKFSSYDGLIITGASKTPVYLWINNGKAELRDASSLWGKDSHETVDLVKREVGQANAKVACIGPAGENLVKSAMVLSDYNNSASHGGGVLMGSKKLKAIAVWGTERVPVKDKSRLVEAGNRWREKIKPILYPQGRFGVGYGRELGTLVYRNWQSTLFPEANRGFEEEEFTPRPCFQCNRECPFDARITVGKHAGHVATLNAGGEHYEGAAYTFGIGGQAVHYLADILDRMGMDGCQFGCAAGLAFEAYDKGLLTTKQTDGLELRWGDADAVEKLMHRVARREGWLGNVLADGPKAAAEAIGGEAPNFVVHIKGGAPALHDWRPYLSQMLGQMTACGGGKPRFQGFEMRGDPSLGYPEKTNAQAREGKAKETFTGGLYRMFCGTAGVCFFGARGGIFPHVVEAMQAATGWEDFSEEEALEIGERVWQMEHLFHLRFGWSPEEDLKNVGPRFLEAIPDGQFKGFTVSRFLPDLLYDFYDACGWDKETGRPTEATLKRLNIQEYNVNGGRR